MLARLKIDPFLLGLVAMVVLALIWPTPGVSGGALCDLLKKREPSFEHAFDS